MSHEVNVVSQPKIDFQVLKFEQILNPNTPTLRKRFPLNFPWLYLNFHRPVEAILSEIKSCTLTTFLP